MKKIRILSVFFGLILLLLIIKPESITAFESGNENEEVPGVIILDVEKNVPSAVDMPQDIRVYGELETKYPANPQELLTKYPKVRNQATAIQGEGGTCWAHAAIATAEFYTKKRENKISDYSELALAYCTYSSLNDPLGGLNGDKNWLDDGSSFLSHGGNGYIAYMTLFKRFGVSDEKVATYNNVGINKVKKSGLTMKEALKDVLHLKSFSMINVKDGRDRIKEEIKKNGCVMGYINSDASYYNNKTNSHYCYNTKHIDHAIAIVGWDDSYSAGNFRKKPKGNGAWLVRNSWGANDFSRRGYFWMSYYDTAFSGDLPIVFSAEYAPYNDYDNNYQYDGSITDVGIPGSKKISGANIFKVHAGHEQESLKAIAVGIGSSNTNYNIEVYKNPKANDPCSGTKLNEATTIGYQKYPGMYTVPLRNSVILNKGDTFSIVVTLEGNRGATLKAESTVSNTLKTNAAIKKGQSFYKSDSSAWRDLYGTGKGNIRIKAYTDNIKKANTISQGWYYNPSIRAMQYYIKDGEYVKGWKWMDLSTKETTPHYSFFNLKNGALYTNWHQMGADENEKISHWSYFGNNGWLRTGWQWLGAQDGEKTPHWSYFGNNGWLRTGWVQLGKGTGEPDDNNEKHWSYFGNNGWLRTGWVLFGKGTNEPDNNSKKHWSYFDARGWLKTDCTIKMNGNSYTFDKNGWLISAPIGL